MAEQGVNAFKIRKVLSKIGDVKLVTIWMTAKRFGNRRSVDENIGDFVSPHFDQAESDYHHPALHNAPGHQIDDRTPPKGLFEADDFQRWISMRIVENTIADINEALARKFGRRIEGPAQLVVDGEGIIFVRKTQISFVVPRPEGIELLSPAQHFHFLADQRRFNAAGETGANGEELVFPFQLEAGRDDRCEQLLAQPLKSQRPVALVGQCPLSVPATATRLEVMANLFGAGDVGRHGGEQLRRRRVVLVVAKVGVV